MIKQLVYTFILSLLIFASCNNKEYVYQDYVKIEDAKWEKTVAAEHHINIKEPNKAYTIYFNIRNFKDYEKSNLWLFADIIYPNGTTQKDTIELTLANDKGKWLGKSAGYLVDLKSIYKKNIILQDTGMYAIKIYHGMYQNPLKNISNVGITIENYKEPKQ